MGFLTLFWAKIKQWFWAFAFALGVFLYVKGRSDGVSSAQGQVREDILEDISKQKEIRDEVSGLGSDDISDRLHRWVSK